MKRRTFLQTTGLALAAASPALAEDRPGTSASKPKLLVTAAQLPLAQAIADELAQSYQVVGSGFPFLKSDFSDPVATAALVQGVTAIVHVAEPDPGIAGEALIDYRTRGTFALLQAAVREGVSAVVYLSSLKVMYGYEPGYQVSEDWQPRPAAQPDPLSHFLSEFTCREFAREGKLRVAVLRLGPGADSAPQDPLRLETHDAVQAVSRALTALLAPRSRLEAWSVFQIVSDPRNRRFPATKAQRLLGYRPQATATQPRKEA